MSGGLVDKVYIGLDSAPAAFDIKGRILGQNGTNLEYIRSETGAVAVLKGDKFEPLHLALHHTRSEAITAAKSLALNLIETIKAELVQWSAAQAGGPPPALNVPPPTLTTTSAPPQVAPPAMSVSTASTINSPAPSAALPPAVSVAPATAPLMTVRQPQILQMLPQQQQYILNQENGQLIPIIQPGMQVQNQPNFTSLPLAQSLGLQQQNFGGTQFVDLSGMQPVNLGQLRLGGVPSSMSMILQNGLTFPQAGINANDTTTVSSATSTPVVCAAQNTNSSQKIFYSTDKVGDKNEVKYHIQGGDTVQWAMPGSQTMLIPYQQLQDLTSNQAGLHNIQAQQFVSIAPAGGLQQNSLPLSAAQFQQLQASGTIMHLNQKNSSTPTKVHQEQRGQKRLSDGSPSLQLRPIAPAGSHVTQDKSTTREIRAWNGGTVRDNTVVSMGMKINPTHGTIIHVSSGQQTNVSASGVTPDGSGMYIRQIDRNAIQIQTSKDGQKQDITTNKIQSTAQNVQMITVPQGMTVLQNPLNIGQMPTVLGQHNNQVYMIPANQHNMIQGGLPQGLLGQQVLQPGQNVTVMQPNQLGMPNSVQYNVPIMPMNMQPNAQYMQTGINLNTQLSAQQINAALAGQQLGNPNLTVSGAIPIVQAPPPGSPMPNAGQTLAAPQAQQVQQILPQNSTFIPTSQYASLPPQYVMQANSGAMTMQNNPNIQYSIQGNTNTNPAPNSAPQQPNTTAESDSQSSTTATNQNNYITSSSQENAYAVPPTQNMQNNQQGFPTDGATTPATTFTPTNQNTSAQNFNSNQQPVNNQPSFTVSQVPTTQPPPNYPGNGNNPNPTPSYGSAPNGQNAPPNYSPSPTPAPNQNYSTPPFPPNGQGQNPYPNATGQNMAAYANNQYQYSMQTPNRPWFRPRYNSPQGSPYNPATAPPPSGPPMPVPPPTANYNYWQDNS